MIRRDAGAEEGGEGGRGEKKKEETTRSFISLSRPLCLAVLSPAHPPLSPTMQRALAARPTAARPIARRGAVVARAATKAPVSGERERDRNGGGGGRGRLGDGVFLPTAAPPPRARAKVSRGAPPADQPAPEVRGRPVLARGRPGGAPLPCPSKAAGLWAQPLRYLAAWPHWSWKFSKISEHFFAKL